jgi:hypothetical protein
MADSFAEFMVSLHALTLCLDQGSCGAPPRAPPLGADVLGKARAVDGERGLDGAERRGRLVDERLEERREVRSFDGMAPGSGFEQTTK